MEGTDNREDGFPPSPEPRANVGPVFLRPAWVPHPVPQPPARLFGRGLLIPLVLFIATCLSTATTSGISYAMAVMGILLAHELGHFFQARRYRVPASLPYFIPMPFSPIGTMGAVIFMQPQVADRKALFDIAITGPLAGLIPAVVLYVLGLQLSTVVVMNPTQHVLLLGDPILVKWLNQLTFGTMARGEDVNLHPIAFAGWVGIFITALNLIPIGQLDGGHILYALLRRKAHGVAMTLMLVAVVLVVLNPRYAGWTLMLFLLAFMGPRHPPTADDEMPLGTARIVLGWITLLFVIVGFTPTPFQFWR